MFAAAEQNRRDRKVHLVDEARLQILPDRRDTAADPHVAAIRRFARTLERHVDALGDKVKRGAALHRDGGARMVRQHEYRAVIRWAVAPPALPALVRPRAAHRPEHVAAEYPCADIGEAARREIIIGTGIAAILSEHLAERAGRVG